MKHELIKTEHYLLVVSDEEIEDGNFIYETNIGEVSRVDIKYCELLKTGVKVEPFVKVLAHLPLNGAEHLEGVDLLPPIPKEQYDIEQMAIEHSVSELSMYPETSSTLTESEVLRLRSLIEAHSYRGFKKGCNKAKETYKYTEEDMQRSLLKMAQKCREEMNLSLSSYVNNISKNSDEIIQSLNQPKLPIAFDSHTQRFADRNNILKQWDGPKTITNSEGKTEWVGNYIF